MADPMENLNKATAALNDVAARAGSFWDDADTRITAREKEVDTFLASARDEFPAVNLLRNARAREVDGGGNLLSPFAFYVAPAWTTTVSQRVLPHKDQDIPPEIAAMSSWVAPFNVVEVTGSKGDGPGTAVLLPNRPVRGRVSAGVLAAQVSEDGIGINGKAYQAGAVITGILQYLGDRYSTLDGLTVNFTGPDQKIWLLGPWVAAGKVTEPPLFLLASPYYFGDT